MGRYVVRRLLLTLPILLLVTIVVFALVEIAPGDMIDFFADPESLGRMGPEELAALRERLGLDQPAPLRYLAWLGQVLQGDLGFSLIRAEEVSSILLRRFGNSMILMGTGFVVAIVVGLTLGIYTALRQYSVADFALSGLSFVGISMPAFISGIIAMYVFAVLLGWFPSGGMHTPGDNSLGDLVLHLVLPAGVLSLIHMAAFMRYTRFSMLEVLKQDYLVTARAKGLPRRLVIWRHAFRNTLVPVVTLVGLSIPELMVGAVFLETIYAWPGMGRLYYDAVVARDFPIIMGANLIIAVVVLLGNLATDLAYAVVDPRVRIEE